MIEIQPPAGWQSTAGLKTDAASASQKSSDAATDAAETFSSNFDDIDSVLESTDTPSPVAQRTGKSTGKPQTKSHRPGSLPTPDLRSSTVNSKQPSQSKSASLSPRSNSSGQSTSHDAQAVLPTEQWTSPEVQQRKKLLLRMVGMVGVGMLITAGITAILINRNPTDRVISELSDNSNHQAADPADSPTPRNEIDPTRLADDIDGDGDAGPIESMPVDADSSQQNSILKSDSTKESTDDKPSAVSPSPSMTPPPTVLPDSNNPVQAPLKDNEDAEIKSAPIDSKTGIPEPAVFKSETPTDQPSTSLDSLQSQLGELMALLESSGTSLSRIQDFAAAERDEQLIGVPKYFMEPPDIVKLDVEKQMSLPCGGLRYDNANLTIVLDDITAITGVAMTIDPDSMLAKNHNINPAIKLDVRDLDYAAAVDAIINPLGLVREPGNNQDLILKLADQHKFIEESYPLPEFPVEDEAAREQAAQELVRAIQSFVSPMSWLQEPEPAAIAVANGRLTVSNTVLAHHQISMFLEKIQSAIILLEEPSNLVAQQSLITKWDSISQTLNQPAGLHHAPDRLLVDLLEQIRQHTGITVLVDWDAVQPLGWTPMTIVPGKISEDNLANVIKELARAMSLTTRTIDATTLQLTTFESASQAIDLEIYSFGKILAGKLNEEQALRLIMETLGRQLQTANVRFVYEPKYQIFVLSAPQSLQKQFAAVVRQLEQL